MSQYSWPVRQIWFGVEGPKPELPMLGIIKRSGQCRALGHFCHVKISVNGKKVWASGAEDRTFYIHLVTWDDIGRVIPKDMIPALGWGADGNGYYCLHKGEVVEYGSGGSLHPVSPEKWGSWKDDIRTLIERGATIPMKNHYIALLEEPTKKVGPRSPKPRVTLPVGCWNAESQEFEDFEGRGGNIGLWRGKPPPWCVQVVQVRQNKSSGGWIHVRDDEITIVWRRNEVSLPSGSTEAGV